MPWWQRVQQDNCTGSCNSLMAVLTDRPESRYVAGATGTTGILRVPYAGSCKAAHPGRPCPLPPIRKVSHSGTKHLYPALSLILQHRLRTRKLHTFGRSHISIQGRIIYPPRLKPRCSWRPSLYTILQADAVQIASPDDQSGRGEVTGSSLSVRIDGPTVTDHCYW